MDKLILVLYVDIGDLLDVESVIMCERVGKQLFPEEVVMKLDATTFIIPVRGGGTRLECISPKFIVDAEVMRDHRLKLDILNENLDHFINQKNDGKK